MSQFKISTDKTKIDKELLAFSGSTDQYAIDMENFLNRVMEGESKRRQNRKERRSIKRKSKRNK